MINETYEGCNYVKPEDPELFCQLMIDCENDDIENIKKHITCKEDTKQKLMWLSIKGGNCYVPEQSLLSIASRYGNTEIMKYLISLGADVDDLDEYACTPLHFACLKRKENNKENIEAVKILLEAGADPNKISYKKFYRIYGINTNKRSGTGETPLHNAAIMGNLEIVKYLLENGAKPSLFIKNNSGRTPIDYVNIYEDDEKTEEQKKIVEVLKSAVKC